MKLKELHNAVVKFGLESDPRTKKEISEELKRVKNVYKKLKGLDRELFDKERFQHPYADTRILCGDPNQEIRTIMVGIDMETSELLLADRLMEKGLSIDLVMSHHPEGRALSNLSEVMHIHKDVLTKFGIKREIAKSLLDERIGEVSRGISAINHTRSVEAARLLNIPYMCVHTPADNHVSTYLQSLFDKRKPKQIKDVLGILKSIPEYQTGMERSAGPMLIIGKEENKAGKVFVDMTGGTEGPKKVFARLSQAGVGTIVGMHFSETHYRNAKSEHLNVIVAGHIASDNLGMNLLIDKLEKKGQLNVIDSSGFERVKRKK